MEPCDMDQIPCLREQLSAPVLRRKRSQTKKKGRLVLERPMAIKKKAKQVKKVSSKTVKKSESIKRKRTRAHENYDDPKTQVTVKKNADRLLTSLAIKTPSFMKDMFPSNVTYSFWMIMPKDFCNLYLPSHDATIILEDEWGEIFKTNYLVDRHGLSAGWRGFSMSHALHKGDILIFNLIEPCRFRVHIVRVHGQDVINAALCLMNLEALGPTTESDLAKQDNKKRKRGKKYADTTVLDAPRKQVKVEEKCNVALASQSETCSDSLCSEVVQGAKISDNLISTGHYFPESGDCIYM